VAKTLVGTPDPPEPERQPEIVYCVTSLGPSNSNGFVAPALLTGTWAVNGNQRWTVIHG